MALAGVNPEDMGRHIPEGEYTSKVYGYIRDGKHTQVIKILEKELAVVRSANQPPVATNSVATLTRRRWI